MASARSEKSRGEARPDSLAGAALRTAVLAPGGFVMGYLLGVAVGRLVGGCPLRGDCGVALPIFLSLPTAIIGMGAANTLAAARVRYWWEGVAVWAVGIAAVLVLVVTVGLLGAESGAGRLIGLGWLLAAAALGFAGWFRKPVTPG